MDLLVATHNQGKVAELSAMLEDAGVRCMSLADAGIAHDVEETGTTFLANATLKAVAYARLSGMLTLADDSGLEVDALDGEPGVHTARFGGAGLAQHERNALLLSKLVGLEGADRSGRFRSVVVLARPDGAVIASAEGQCEGRIALAPAGDGGFGYDPIFWLPDRGATMAQLSPEQKHAISHRGRAFRKIEPVLRDVLGHS